MLIIMMILTYTLLFNRIIFTKVQLLLYISRIENIPHCTSSLIIQRLQFDRFPDLASMQYSPPSHLQQEEECRQNETNTHLNPTLLQDSYQDE